MPAKIIKIGRQCQSGEHRISAVEACAAAVQGFVPMPGWLSAAKCRGGYPTRSPESHLVKKNM